MEGKKEYLLGKIPTEIKFSQKKVLPLEDYYQLIACKSPSEYLLSGMRNGLFLFKKSKLIKRFSNLKGKIKIKFKINLYS